MIREIAESPSKKEGERGEKKIEKKRYGLSKAKLI